MRVPRVSLRFFHSQNVEVSAKPGNVRIDNTTEVYSYDEALDLTGHGWYNHIVLIACSLVNLGAGMDMFCFGIVVAMAGCDLGIEHTETGLLISSPFVGMLFAYPWGYFADIKGRRLALLISTSVGFTLSALSCFAPCWQVLLVFKILGSSFSAASYTLTSTYLGENVGSLRRAQYISAMNGVNLGSELFGFIFAYFLQAWNVDVQIWSTYRLRPWRVLVLVMAIVPIIGTIIIYFLHESPKFLADKGDTKKALSIMKKIYTRNRGYKEDYIVKRLVPINAQTSSFWKSIITHSIPIFQRPLLWRTLQLIFLLIVCATTSNTFMVWFTDLANSYFFSSYGTDTSKITFCDRIITHISTNDEKLNCSDAVSINTIYLGMGLGTYMMAVGLITSALAAWRRPTLLGLLVISAASLLLVNAFVQPTVNMLFFVVFQLTGSGLGIILSYFVELYPTSNRGVAAAVAMMVTRIMSMVGVNVVGGVIVNYCAMTFYCWSLFVLCGVVVVFFLPKDNK